MKYKKLFAPPHPKIPLASLSWSRSPSWHRRRPRTWWPLSSCSWCSAASRPCRAGATSACKSSARHISCRIYWILDFIQLLLFKSVQLKRNIRVFGGARVVRVGREHFWSRHQLEVVVGHDEVVVLLHHANWATESIQYTLNQSPPWCSLSNELTCTSQLWAIPFLIPGTSQHRSDSHLHAILHRS